AATVAQSPVGAQSYDLPRVATSNVALRTWLDPTKIQLIGQDRFFGLAGNPTFDWPVPKGAVPSIALRTWLDPLKLELIGQDRIYGAPGEVPAYDWPNPRGPVPNI